MKAIRNGDTVRGNYRGLSFDHTATVNDDGSVSVANELYIGSNYNGAFHSSAQVHIDEVYRTAPLTTGAVVEYPGGSRYALSDNGWVNLHTAQLARTGFDLNPGWKELFNGEAVDL